MDRKAFFASVRARTSGVFGTSLTQGQVDGVEAILNEGERRGTSEFHLAAVLAETYHETGGKMQPVTENLSYSAKRMTQVWPKRFPTITSPTLCEQPAKTGEQGLWRPAREHRRKRRLDLPRARPRPDHRACQL